MEATFVATAQAERFLRFLTEKDNRHALVVGEPGSGKTSLIHYAARHLEAAGVAVEIVSAASGSTLDELIETIARTLDTDRSLTADEIRSYQSGLRIGPIVQRLMERGSGSQAAFLFIDDIDELQETRSVMSLFRELVTIPQRRIRIVLTARRGGLTSRLQRDKSVETFELGGLSSAESAALLQASAGRPIPAPLVSKLVALSNGSPLLLRLFASALDGVGEGEILHRINEWQAEPALVIQILLERAIASVARPAFAIRVIAALSVFGNATSQQLADATGLAKEQVDVEIDGLTQTGFVVSSRDVVSFAHASMREQAAMRFLLVDEILPGNLRFGSEAAENDQLLTTYFVPPPDLSEITAGVKTVVLGDRGAGKSAIYKSLDSLVADDQLKTANRILALSKDAGAFIQRFIAEDTAGSSADRFKALWLFLCSALAARHLQGHLGDDANETGYAKDAWRLLRQVGWQDAIKGEPWWRRAFVKTRGLLPEKVAFSAGPVTIKPEWSRASSGSARRNSMELGAFIKATDAVLGARKLMMLIVVDQIDELYKYARQDQEAMVQGLLMAESYLSQTQAIRLIALLRTDLFEVYDIQEKNKFVARTIRLRWSWSDLLTQMLRRTYGNEALRAISERVTDAGITQETTELHLRILFPESVEGLPLVDWLYESLKNGRNVIPPRQVILFLNHLKQHSSRPRRQTPIFSESELLAAMRDVSESAFQEVVSDFRVAVTFMHNCRAAKQSLFRIQDVDALFDRTEGQPNAQVDFLERLGVLAREITQDGDKPVPQFRVPKLFMRCWN